MSTGRQAPEELRQRAREIVERLKTDESFRRSVEKDPAATLTAAGIPEKGVDEFTHELNEMAEVAGYVGCPHTCYVTCEVLTCWWTD